MPEDCKDNHAWKKLHSVFKIPSLKIVWEDLDLHAASNLLGSIIELQFIIVNPLAPQLYKAGLIIGKSPTHFGFN